LIDGDGSLCVYNNKACSCEITLEEKDVKTLYKIKKFAKCGSVLKRTNVKAFR
jgi:LAGLIDADG endonuclease